MTFYLIYSTFTSLGKWQRYSSFTKSVPNHRSLTLREYQIPIWPYPRLVVFFFENGTDNIVRTPADNCVVDICAGFTMT